MDAAEAKLRELENRVMLVESSGKVGCADEAAINARVDVAVRECQKQMLGRLREIQVAMDAESSGSGASSSVVAELSLETSLMALSLHTSSSSLLM